MRLTVVGGGIVGLATARLAGREVPGIEVVVLEKETAVARHQTSHNSGVVHAGLYYAPGSLKARLCRRGVGLLREYCTEKEIAFEPCGKLVVATREDELRRLKALQERAEANGVPGIRTLGESEIRQVEPHVRGIAAVHSPETAITDFRAVAESLRTELIAAGGEVRTGIGAARVTAAGGRPVVELADGGRVETDAVLVCAGLQGDRLARASGQPRDPQIVPFRGKYWALREDRRNLVRGLIYPVPDPSLPFLGVHLTRHIDGSVLVGPNAILALAREGYDGRTVSLGDVGEIATWPGTWRLLRRHWRAGAAELSLTLRKGAFARAARRYVPALAAGDLVPAVSGIRAQAVDAEGALVDDFRIARSPGVVWVRNAPSPAATSSMAIAEELLQQLDLAG